MNDKKNTSVEFYPAALTISGSNAGGTSGIQADLRTFNAYGIFGCSAVTAVAARNPLETTGIVSIPAEAVALQIETVLKEIPVKFAKTGVLTDADCVIAVAEAVKKHKLDLVCDLSASECQNVEVLKENLLPLCRWITADVPAAERILKRKIRDFNAMKFAAQELFEATGANVIICGEYSGNLPSVADAVCVRGELYTLKAPGVEPDTASDAHGCSCTFSAALTAGFAMGMDWKNSIADARAFVLGSLRETAMIGNDIFAMYPPTEDCRHEIKLSANTRKK